MKKLLQILILLLIPFASYAQQIEVDGMIFDPNYDENWQEDGTCTLKCVNEDLSEIVVPDKVYNGEKEYIVNKIGRYIFFDSKTIVSVTLPNTIKTIEERAFAQAKNLKKVNFPEGLERIEETAFRYCESLESPTFPSTLKFIGDEAFACTNSLGDLTFPSSIEYIGEGCFNRLYNVKSITFEDGVDELNIGNNCFEVAYYLSNLYVGRNIKAADNAFYTFSSISNIITGNCVTDLSWIKPSEINDLSQIVCDSPFPPTIGKFTPQQYANTFVFVPAEHKSAYENDANWAFFSNLSGLEIPYMDYELSVDPQDLTINVGETEDIYVDVTPFVNTFLSMNIDSYDIISSQGFGKIQGIKAGEADVVFTMMLNNKKAVCHITVLQPATSILLNKKDITLQKGESVNILANVGPVDVSDPTVTWTSSNPYVATVENGLVTAVGGGECDIVATTHNGLEARCHVSVPVSPESISFEAAEVTVLLGDKVALTPILSPEDVTEKSLVWATSDANVATVADGVVTCVGLGEATITATTVNNLTAECKVIVNPILAETITLDKTEVEVPIGETFTLTATISPDNTTDKTVTWASSDPEVATVEDGVVSCVGVGEATITATTVNGLTANCTVKVQMILVESILIDPSEVVAEQGDKVQLTAIVLPENATNKNVEWTSDNEFVARVDENGLVTIISKNVTTIHAKATDGSGVEGTCEVTGIAGVESLLIDGKQWNVFTPDGVLIRSNVTIEDIRQLAPAIYIISDGTRTLKLVR